MSPGRISLEFSIRPILKTGLLIPLAAGAAAAFLSAGISQLLIGRTAGPFRDFIQDRGDLFFGIIGIMVGLAAITASMFMLFRGLGRVSSQVQKLRGLTESIVQASEEMEQAFDLLKNRTATLGELANEACEILDGLSGRGRRELTEDMIQSIQKARALVHEIRETVGDALPPMSEHTAKSSE